MYATTKAPDLDTRILLTFVDNALETYHTRGQRVIHKYVDRPVRRA